MPHHFFIFFILLLLIAIPNADAETVRAYLLADEGQTGGNSNDEIITENNVPVELDPVTVSETTETVGGVEVALTQEVQFVASNNDVVVLKNTALPTVTAEIPNGAFVSAPASWNGELTTPTTVAVTGTVDTAFVAPTTGILFGSPDVILVFNQAVTIILEGTTGQTAYKLAGSNTWILISGCTGTYANPNDPPVNGECSISDGTNTKILTYHFTHFSGLSSTPTSTPTSTPATTTSSGNSGGHGNTGVGSPRIFGGSSGSSGGGTYYPPGQTTSNGLPAWFDIVTDWYGQGKISSTEYLKAYQWIMSNILK
jgi:uncharacterized membrane protein YgcG